MNTKEKLIKTLDRQRLISLIKRDIKNIGCIYRSVGKALYDEPINRLAERIVHSIEHEFPGLLSKTDQLLTDEEENAKLAKYIVPILYELFVTVPPLPDKYRQRLHQRAAEVFGPPQTTAQTSTPKQLSNIDEKILAEKELKIINHAKHDPEDDVYTRRFAVSDYDNWWSKWKI